jgi:Transposase DDE domain group 1
MLTECSTDYDLFGRVDRRRVAADFDGGAITSDAGGLLLGSTDRAIGLVERFAACFVDWRTPDHIEHSVGTLIGQRVFGIALGYEDLNDHDELRHDPLMATLAGKLAARRKDCAPLAGKSTLNRLELSREVATLSQDQPRTGGDRGAVRHAVSRSPSRPAAPDRARSRRHR